jgi:hypothetical protein
VQISRNERRGQARAARFVAPGKQCDGITKASENQARGARSWHVLRDAFSQNNIKEFREPNDALLCASALDLLISRSSCCKVCNLSPVLCGVAG